MLNPMTSHGIASSKEESNQELSGSKLDADRHLREKRFFNHFLTTVTVTSYTFLSSTIMKTVELAITSAVLRCLPAGYITCWKKNDFIKSPSLILCIHFGTGLVNLWIIWEINFFYNCNSASRCTFATVKRVAKSSHDCKTVVKFVFIFITTSSLNTH